MNENPKTKKLPPLTDSQANPSSNQLAFIHLVVAFAILFAGLSQICETGWMLLPLAVIAIGTFLGWAISPTIFLFSLPLSLLLDRSGIGPDEWLVILLEGGSPFFVRRMAANNPHDLNTSDMLSLIAWCLTAAGVIATHSIACRYLILRKPPFITGQLVVAGPNRKGSLVDLVFCLTIVVLAIVVMIMWVYTDLVLDSVNYSPRLVQLTRWVLAVGGALVIGLLARLILGLAEAKSMDATSAAGFLANASWADMGKALNKPNRWLMWWRLGQRKKAETRWRRMLRGIKSLPLKVESLPTRPMNGNNRSVKR